MDVQTRSAGLVGDTVAAAVRSMEQGLSPMPDIARGLGELVHADATVYGWLDVRTGECHLATWPDIIDLGLMLQATRDAPRSHPVLDHWLAGNTTVAAVSMLVTDRRAWRHSAAYALLERGVGCTETAGIRLDAGGPLRMIGFARHRDFTTAELGLLERVRPLAVALSSHAEWLAALERRPATDRGCPRQRAATFGITPRELQVLELLAGGLLASTIAARLAISTRTVHRHLSHLYSKLGTHDRLTTVVRAQQAGLLPGPGATGPGARPAPLGSTERVRRPAQASQ